MLIRRVIVSFLTGFDQEGARLLRESTSFFSALVNGPLHLLAWLFLPLENRHWRAVRSRFTSIYRTIEPDRTRPLDGLRIALQSLFLLFFHRDDPAPKRRVRRRSRWAAWRARQYARIKMWDAHETVRIMEKGEKPRLGLLRTIGLVALGGVAISLFLLVATQPLDPRYQAVFCVCTIVVALLLRRIRIHVTVVAMILLSALVSTRYIWWRFSETLNTDSVAGLCFSVLLLLAELYTFVLMVMSYFQTFWILPRDSYPMPEDRSTWPHVDICIPTYNEPLDVVRATVYGALSMDWPKEKLHVWVLDDGDRDEFRDFAADVGAGYIRRPVHNHAKAGNLNHAFTKISGEFVAIFDCDHIPVRSFLTRTMGWMLHDPKVALVQTPHHFYSPAPYQRNLRLTDAVPQEDALFHTFIQRGNDIWNAVLFCGSCAVMRRKALDEIHGIATDTVTEDAHTSLRLYRRGWRSAYIATPLAAGLATDTLAAHIGQRIRWARGMTQIFRIDNPLLGKGLTLGQRLCFFSAMIYFLLGIPRIIFLLAPLPFVFFDINIIQASGAAILVFVLPHLAHSIFTNEFVQRGLRYPMMGEIYDTVLSCYIVVPTTVALFAPHYGKFNVTSKGERVDDAHLDWHIARPYVILLLLNLSALFWLIGRAIFANLHDAMTLMVNAVWLFYNMLLLSSAVAVAVETVQERRFPRVRLRRTVSIRRPDGTVWHATMTDFSQNGASLLLHPESGTPFQTSESVELLLEDEGVLRAYEATVRRSYQRTLGLEVHFRCTEDERRFVAATFCLERMWDGAVRKPLVPMRVSLRALFSFAFLGIRSIGSYAPTPIAWVFVVTKTVLQWFASFLPRFPQKDGTAPRTRTS